MVTSALLHILKRGGDSLINHVLDARTQQLPSNEIAVASQVGGNASVPAAVIEADYRFKLIVESKIKKNALSGAKAQDQYKNHLQLCKNPGDMLIYITPDNKRPSLLKGKELWYGWREIMDLLENYGPRENDPVLTFMIEQFHILLENLNVCDFVTDRVIVVGGNRAEDIARQYNLYICQNNRFNINAKYIAFACKNRIEFVYEIIGTPRNNVDLSTDELIKSTNYLAKNTYQSGDLRQVFELKLHHRRHPMIVNDTVDKNGQRCAFVQRQMYTTLEKILTARHTSDLR